MRIAVVHHLAVPFTGHAGDVLREQGAELVERHVVRGDPLPSLDEVDGVVSLGGEQSVLDIARIEPLAREAAWLREAVGRGVPVAGVCLGSQLLAHALGGEVVRLPRRLREWVPLELTGDAGADPLFAGVQAGWPVLHWNEDSFEPPAGSVALARGDAGRVTAFRAGGCAWGLQFHPETGEQALDSWYRDYAQDIEPGVARAAREADARHLPGQRALSERLFGGFARMVAEQAAARRR